MEIPITIFVVTGIVVLCTFGIVNIVDYDYYKKGIIKFICALLLLGVIIGVHHHRQILIQTSPKYISSISIANSNDQIYIVSITTEVPYYTDPIEILYTTRLPKLGEQIN